MTPIEMMEAAAKRHPVLVRDLLALGRKEREEQINFLVRQLIIDGRSEELDDLALVRGYVEIKTLSALFH